MWGWQSSIPWLAPVPLQPPAIICQWLSCASPTALVFCSWNWPCFASHRTFAHAISFALNNLISVPSQVTSHSCLWFHSSGSLHWLHPVYRDPPPPGFSFWALTAMYSQATHWKFQADRRCPFCSPLHPLQSAQNWAGTLYVTCRCSVINTEWMNEYELGGWKKQDSKRKRVIKERGTMPKMFP